MDTQVTPHPRPIDTRMRVQVAQFITYPFDTIRTRLAVSAHKTYQVGMSWLLHCSAVGLQPVRQRVQVVLCINA